MNIQWCTRRRRKSTQAAAAMLLASALCGSVDGGPGLLPATSTDMSAGARIRRHIEILAADAMQGREAGTEGHRLAAAYVSDRFAQIGLRPFGDADGYLHNVDFLQTRLVERSASMVLHRAAQDLELEFGSDFVVSGGFGVAAESITAPLLFVGFGIRAPEYQHDDFADVDARGKILVEFTGAPPRFAPDERAYYSSATVKQRTATALGAVGIITIRTPVDLPRLTWPRMLASAATPAMRWLQADGEPRDGYPQLAASAVLSETGAQRLCEFAGRTPDELFGYEDAGARSGFDLGISVTLERRSEQTRATSPNVLGYLRGAEPKLAGEYVLFTAHLDHLGIGNTGESDNIYNGAYDNAAGVAVMLEIAESMADSNDRPKRSIAFAAVTAEEKGLRGSDYLANNPPVPIDSIVAVINMDMPYFGYPIADVEAFGAEHSTLHGTLQQATAALGLQLTPDPRPELVRFIRSDQFSFVKQGVPGLNLKPGSMSSDPEIDAAAMRDRYLAEFYHSPADDLDLPYSAEGAGRFAQLALTLGLMVANDPDRPAWQHGDFFGDRFGR
jgi:Peptidase family M28